MVGHIQKQQLRRPDHQQGFELRNLGGQLVVAQPLIDRLADRAQMPDGRGGQSAGQAAVALGHAVIAQRFVERLVERQPPVQHIPQDLTGHTPRRQTGGFGIIAADRLFGRGSAGFGRVGIACHRSVLDGTVRITICMVCVSPFQPDIGKDRIGRDRERVRLQDRGSAA